MPDYSGEYTIKKLEPGEFHLITPLMKDCFGMDVNIAYFKWKFLDNPAGTFIGFVAVHNENGSIGAFYGVIPELYRINGEEHIIYQSCDTMTHSRHRRRGLFQLLALHCYNYLREEGKLFVIGYGGAMSTPGLEKFGWRHVVVFRNYFIPRQLCYLNAAARTSGDAVVEIHNVADIAPLLEKGASKPVESVRHPRVVQWRYGNPRVKYEVQAHRQSGRFDGYVCFYTDNRSIFLFDYNFATSQARRRLMSYLKRRVVREGLKGIVALAAEGSGTARTLTRSGFITNPFNKGPLHTKTYFMFLAPTEVMDRYEAVSNWHIEGFDHDSI